MVTDKPRIFFVVPNYRQVGGIAKILDYAVHADPDRFEVWFVTLSNQNANAGLTDKPYYQRSPHNIQFTLLENADLRDGDMGDDLAAEQLLPCAGAGRRGSAIPISALST